MSTSQIPTPHIEAKAGDFAKTVLMPGDPLRARFIAETFLEHPILVNNVRGIQGYTGAYQGKRISVMASGMGMPSIGIYSYELYHFYGVESILRIGSAGAISPLLHVRDIVAGVGACTNSDFARQYGLPGAFAPIADYGLLCAADGIAQKMGIELKMGNLFSSDTFKTSERVLHSAWLNSHYQTGLKNLLDTAVLEGTDAAPGRRRLPSAPFPTAPLPGKPAPRRNGRQALHR